MPLPLKGELLAAEVKDFLSQCPFPGYESDRRQRLILKYFQTKDMEVLRKAMYWVHEPVKTQWAFKAIDHVNVLHAKYYPGELG
jgi:hypothetical protein